MQLLVSQPHSQRPTHVLISNKLSETWTLLHIIYTALSVAMYTTNMYRPCPCNYKQSVAYNWMLQVYKVWQVLQKWSNTLLQYHQHEQQLHNHSTTEMTRTMHTVYICHTVSGTVYICHTVSATVYMSHSVRHCVHLSHSVSTVYIRHTVSSTVYICQTVSSLCTSVTQCHPLCTSVT